MNFPGIIMDNLLAILEHEIADPEEETFLVFSQPLPSRSLGFVDSNANRVCISVAGRDFDLRQSTALLRSDRAEGTTGAVLWQVTPKFAEWIASPSNVFNDLDILHQGAEVLELGCGISGLISLVLAPKIRRYINTDQEYVLKLLRENITSSFNPHPKKHGKLNSNALPETGVLADNIIFHPLDWENDDVAYACKELGFADAGRHISMVVACDCIYNEHLVKPFVNACAAICEIGSSTSPTVSVVAQQLRSPEIFELWLKTFQDRFRVWRLQDKYLSADLIEGSGFVIHIGVLR